MGLFNMLVFLRAWQMQHWNRAHDHQYQSGNAGDQHQHYGLVLAQPTVRHDGAKDRREKGERVKRMVDHGSLVGAKRQLTGQIDNQNSWNQIVLLLNCFTLNLYLYFSCRSSRPAQRTYIQSGTESHADKAVSIHKDIVHSQHLVRGNKFTFSATTCRSSSSGSSSICFGSV